MISLVLGFSLAWLAGVGSSAGPEGFWRTPAGTTLQVYACGQEDCFRIVKLSPTVPEKLDTKNPDAQLRSRALCGLQIGSGFQKADGGRLTGGHIYDPESGRMYTGTADTDGDAMRLRGYIGISLLGRTEVWHRTAAVDGSECR